MDNLLKVGERVQLTEDIHDGSDSRPPRYLARDGDVVCVTSDQEYGRSTLWVRAAGGNPFRVFSGEYRRLEALAGAALVKP